MAIDVYEIRRKNLSSLLEPRGKAAEIAGKIDSSASYLSTVKSGIRNLGNEMARRIEEAEGLEHGWLDRQHGDEGDFVITASSIDELADKLKTMKSEQVAELFYKVMLGSKDEKKGE